MAISTFCPSLTKAQSASTTLTVINSQIPSITGSLKINCLVTTTRYITRIYHDYYLRSTFYRLSTNLNNSCHHIAISQGVKKVWQKGKQRKMVFFIIEVPNIVQIFSIVRSLFSVPKSCYSFKMVNYTTVCIKKTYTPRKLLLMQI